MPHRCVDDDDAAFSRNHIMSSSPINASSSHPNAIPSPKRFLPQPIETSTKSRRSAPFPNSTKLERESQKVKPDVVSAQVVKGGSSRRFKPEPIETSKRSSKDRPKSSDADSTTAKRESTPQREQGKGSGDNGRRRRFVPDLIETSRLSRRSGDSASTVRFANDIDAASRNYLDLPRKHGEQRHGLLHAGPNGAVHSGASEVHGGPRRTTSLTGARQHSFQVPSLEPIESSESDGSRCPSLSTSPTAASEEGGDLNKDLNKSERKAGMIRDESLSGYLRDLAAKAAERQLRDQAMAAFPNSDFHEHVNHFDVDRESEESEESDEDVAVDFYSRSQEVNKGRVRRQSAADLVWEVLEMRRHHEKLEKERRSSVSKRKEADNHHKDRSKDPFLAALTFTKQGAIGLDVSGQPKSIIGGWQRGVGLESMRNAANPPMLGGDLKFQMFRSPQATILDVDKSPSSSLQNLPRHKSGGGLWRGYCVARDDEPALREERPPGIHSHVNQRRDTLMNHTLGHEQAMAPTPPVSPSICDFVMPDCCLEQGNRTEEEIDREASDEFVTQVYNYLSLGYPSLARKYDHELSRVSEIPLEELSRDDRGSEAKGFVGLEEGKGITMKAAVDGSCARWKALRLYIRKWMRQHPDINTGHLGPDAWGVRARRGSWAI